MKRGFTLAELVVTLGIVSVIAYIMAPVLGDARPNKDLLMFRKAYYRVERAISELVLDDDLYGDDEGQQDGLLSNTKEVAYRGQTYSGKTKFCGLLAAKLNAKEVDCEGNSFIVSGAAGTFKTSDGIVWYLLLNDMSAGTGMQMDVNGEDKTPNCLYNTPMRLGAAKKPGSAALATSTPTATCYEPDTFSISVAKDGRVQVGGEMEKEYLLRKNTTMGGKFETMTDPRTSTKK